MKTWKRIFALLLALCLLAGCGTEEAPADDPVITPVPELPPVQPEQPAEPAPLQPADPPAADPAPEAPVPVEAVTALELTALTTGALLRLDDMGRVTAEGSLTEGYTLTPEGDGAVLQLTLRREADLPAVLAALEAGLLSGDLDLPVRGLGSRLSGVPEGEKLFAKAAAIFEAGRDYLWVLDRQSWTRREQQDLWAAMDRQGLPFAQSILDHVLDRYLTEELAGQYFPGSTAGQVRQSPAMSAAFALSFWGYGAVEEGRFTDLYGRKYSLQGADYPTAREFFDLMARFYDHNYTLLEDSEGVGTGLVRPVLHAFVAQYGAAGTVESISGLTGAGRTVTLELTEPVAGAAAALCIPVPGTAGEWQLLEQGADYALLQNAAGQRRRLVQTADQATALLEGKADSAILATPDGATLEALTAAGFRWEALAPTSLGYIGINGDPYSGKTRAAIAALLDPALSLDHWPAGTAEQAYRPVCGWLAEGETAPAAAGEARELFRIAGYTFGKGTMTDPEGAPASFTFHLPAEDHPAAPVFEAAAAVLRGWGAAVEIVIRPDLVQLVHRGDVAVWALAWDCAGDPAYLAERYDPAADTAIVHAFGLDVLEDTNGGRRLTAAIQKAESALTEEARGEAWAEAFAALEALHVQVPLYRRGAVLVSK